MGSKTQFEYELVPYAPALMESTRAIGYNVEAAIADLVDNSISADATKIDIEFWALDIPYLFVLDNGHGMSESVLTASMQYGSCHPDIKRNTSDLGRFGLGMKTASLSQCRILTVLSKKSGDTYGRRWDLNFINEREQWLLLCLSNEQISMCPGVYRLMEYLEGTLVIWQDFDRLFAGSTDFKKTFGKQMERVRKHLSLVFHRYLTGEKGIQKVEIKINGLSLQPVDPFLLGKSEQIMDLESISIEGSTIGVTPYILPHTSKLTIEDMEHLGGEDGLRRKQGFYVYRNKRLLVWGTWFNLVRKDEFYKLARVKVDIPNSIDHLWKLDIKKSAIVPPDVVRRNLERLIDQIVTGSKRTWTFRRKKETSSLIEHTWERFSTRTGTTYSINRKHPMLKLLIQDMDIHHQKFLEQFLTLIEKDLPLNSLYMDMSEDQIFNHGFENDVFIREALERIANFDKKNTEGILHELEQLRQYEPFASAVNILDEIVNEVRQR